MKKIKIYCDGACSGNPGPGGWGALLIYENKKKEIFGYEENTTNNRMELRAAIEALKNVKEFCEIDVYTDSEYLKKGITEWILSWRQNNWQNAIKKKIKNLDLWQELEKICTGHSIKWHWVKGHSDNEGNNIADKLATNAIKLFNK